MTRAFRALRLANRARVPAPGDEALIVYLNHPSWWDPLVGFILSRSLFPRRRFFAPIDAVSLRRYAIFRRLGMFPVDLESPRGAAQFLRAADTVLRQGHILAITPHGHFTDARVRPVQFRPGLAALLRRRNDRGLNTTVLPLALEYTFWDQRLPEALVNCGEPMRFGPATAAIAPGQDEIQAMLEQGMARTQDELAALSMRRDPGSFAAVLQGRRGSAGFYGLVEAVRSWAGSAMHSGDHRAAPPPPGTQR